MMNENIKEELKGFIKANIAINYLHDVGIMDHDEFITYKAINADQLQQYLIQLEELEDDTSTT